MSADREWCEKCQTSWPRGHVCSSERKPSAQIWWARPKCDESRAFDTGYCSEARPRFGDGNPTEEELSRRGFFKVVAYSAYDQVIEKYSATVDKYSEVVDKYEQVCKERDELREAVKKLEQFLLDSGVSI